MRLREVVTPKFLGGFWAQLPLTPLPQCLTLVRTIASGVLGTLPEASMTSHENLQQACPIWDLLLICCAHRSFGVPWPALAFLAGTPSPH